MPFISQAKITMADHSLEIVFPSEIAEGICKTMELGMLAEYFLKDTYGLKMGIRTCVAEDAQSSYEAVSYTHLDVYKRQIAMFSRKHTADSVTNTIFTFVYPQLFMALFYMLILANIGEYYRMLVVFLMVLIPAMFSDTFAYFIGMALGKRKLCPQISPKKTVAGSIAGIIGGTVGALLITVLFWGGKDILYFMASGAILGTISQFGDLSASFIKRSLNIKDFGKILPGHGGIVAVSYTHL